MKFWSSKEIQFFVLFYKELNSVHFTVLGLGIYFLFSSVL